MTRLHQDFTVFSGNNRTLRFHAFEPDPDSDDPSAERVLNLTGHDLSWAAKRTKTMAEGEELAVEKTTPVGIVITDALNGICEVRLLPEDTEELEGSYYHELESTDGAGMVMTIATGIMTVEPTIA